MIVEVTEYDILEGNSSCHSCPVHRALRRLGFRKFEVSQLGLNNGSARPIAEVGWQWAFWTKLGLRQVQRWIKDFDSASGMQPRPRRDVLKCVQPLTFRVSAELAMSFDPECKLKL